MSSLVQSGRPRARGAIVARGAALAAAALLATVLLAAAASEPARMDFIAQYAAAHLVLEGRGASVVDPDAILAAERAASPARVALLPFVQVPAVALLLAPVAALPFEAAFAAVAVLDAMALALSLALLRAGPPAAWSAALLLLAPPSVLAIAHGQVAPLVLVLVALAARSGPRVGGLALGLCLLRPQTAPLLLVAGILDARRRWWTVAGAGLVAVSSALVVGPDGLARYAGELARASSWSVSGERGLGTSIGWAGVTLLVGAGWLGVVLSVLSLAIGALAVLRTASTERPRAAALWSLLASPHVLVHDAVLAYPAVVALTSRRGAWDAASALAWIVHVTVAPVGALWSLLLAAVTWRRRPA